MCKHLNTLSLLWGAIESGEFIRRSCSASQQICLSLFLSYILIFFFACQIHARVCCCKQFVRLECFEKYFTIMNRHRIIVSVALEALLTK
jgi:hypothetical protein